MIHLPLHRIFATLLAVAWIATPLLLGSQPAAAQTAPKASGKKAPAAEKSAATPKATPRPAAKTTDKPVEKTSARPAEPATAEEAAKVLDLRTIALMEGAVVGNNRSLGMLMYEAKGTPQAAFEFHKQLLSKLGFKELPGGYSDAANCSGAFTKEGYRVAVSTSESYSSPKKPGWSSITLVNDGNVALEKLPVPPGVKPFYPQAYRAAYTTETKPAETLAACRKLLLAAGWEPYGKAGEEMQYFKRNAIKLQLSVSTPPGAEGKTLIQYSSELLQVDLPAPPNTEDPRYTDIQKTLRFDSPQDQTDAILAFYQERLPKMGWKATTEKPVTDDRTKEQFVVYRNAQKELLWLDLTQFTGIVRVKLRHQTAAEVAEEERLFKEKAELEKQKLAKRNMKVKVAVPLPANAENIDKQQESLFEFTLATGSGPAALGQFRKYFLKEGWKEEEGTELETNTGNLVLKKEEARLRFSYFDTGIADAEIRVSGSANMVLEPGVTKEKADAEEPKAEKKPKKKPALPGLPELPPGVEIPEDVKELLKKALEEAGDKTPPPGKKPAPKEAEADEGK